MGDWLVLPFVLDVARNNWQELQYSTPTEAADKQYHVTYSSDKPFLLAFEGGSLDPLDSATGSIVGVHFVLLCLAQRYCTRILFLQLRWQRLRSVYIVPLV